MAKRNVTLSNGSTVGKKSGATLTKNTNGNYVINAWNVSRKRGFVQLTAHFYCNVGEKAKHGDKKVDTTREIWVCTVVFRQTGEQKIMNGIRHNTGKHNGKMYVPDLGMVVNPNANNGGYFGSAMYRENTNLGNRSNGNYSRSRGNSGGKRTYSDAEKAAYWKRKAQNR